MDVKLQLGDIILLKSNTIENQTYLIDFINQEKIKLIDVDTLEKKQITLKDGEITNLDIDTIEILSRANDPGYAKQHDLVPGKWINLQLNGDLPKIIVAEITNVENDMIEIRTKPDEEYLNIDYPQSYQKNYQIYLK